MTVLHLIDKWFTLWVFACGYLTVGYSILRLLKCIVKTMIKVHKNAKLKAEEMRKNANS